MITFKSRNKPKFSQDQIVTMIKMVKARCMISEISKTIGISEKSITNKLPLLGYSYRGLVSKNEK